MFCDSAWVSHGPWGKAMYLECHKWHVWNTIPADLISFTPPFSPAPTSPPPPSSPAPQPGGALPSAPPPPPPLPTRTERQDLNHLREEADINSFVLFTNSNLLYTCTLSAHPDRSIVDKISLLSISGQNYFYPGKILFKNDNVSIKSDLPPPLSPLPLPPPSLVAVHLPPP